MGTRRERVVLELQDDATSGMIRFAASVALARRELDGLNGSVGNVNARVGSVNTSSASSNITNLSRSSDQASGSINQLTGRLGLFADAALILGPGLIPIAAVGAQALGGLTAAATAAAVAGGSAIVAFQGVGDAVKALQAYEDDSSIENLEKAREALRGMAPEARQFVIEFQKFKPVLGDIQKAAASGWFPGLTASLEDFERLGPRIEHIFEAAGSAGGFLVEGAAESLSSKRWAPFLLFLQDEVPGAMASLAHIMGDLAHGAAAMFMAFDPGNDAFLAWLGDVAEGFDRWATSAEGRESIADFLDYARENGPAVADLFSSLVGALAAVVKAAAPIGQVVLQGLTAVADVIKVIADSDMATPLLAAVAAMRLMNRMQGLVAAGQGRVTSAISATGTATRTTTAQAMAAQGVANQINASGGALGSYSGSRAYADYGSQMAAALVAPRPQDVRAAQRAQRAQYARVGGMALGVGLLASGAASEIGLTNTAMLTLAGSMAGPVGAALGAVAGLSLDAAKANNDLTASLDAAGAAIATGPFAAGVDALATARQQQSQFANQMNIGNFEMVSPGQALGSLKNDIEGIFGDSDVEEGEKALKDLERQMFLNQHAAAGLGRAMGEIVGPVDGSARSVKELQSALEAAEPAMETLGISQQDLFKAKQRDDKGFNNLTARVLAEQAGDLNYGQMTQAIADQANYMETATYAAENYQTALRGIADAAGTAAERADAFRESFDALVSPANDAESALVAQVEALREIGQLEAGGGFSEQNEAGRENIKTTIAYTEAVRERVATMINAKRSEGDIAAAVKESRRQFIESGVAAGFSTREMRKRADAIGLTPRLVSTTYKALGIGAYERAIRSAREKVKGIPQRVQTALRTEGVPRTRAEVDALIAKYKLTEKERKALIRLVGAAETQAQASAISAALDRAARNRQARIDITTYENRVVQGARGQGPLRNDNKPAADGDTVPKTGLPYADRHPYLLADGEEVISNRFGQADRHRSLLKAINAGRLADGGTAGVSSVPGDESLSPLARAARESARELNRLQSQLKASSETLERERSRRSELADTIRGNFSDDPFAVDSSSPWGASATADPLGALRGDNADLRKYTSLVGSLRRRGLNGDALAEVDTLEDAQALAGYSKSDLGKYERLYEQRQRLQARAAGVYATGVTGVTPADIDRLAKQVRRVELAVRRAEKSNETAQDRASKEVSSSNRAAARRAAQRRKKSTTS